MRASQCRWLLVIALPVSSPDTARAAWPIDPAVNLPVCTATSNQLAPRVVSDGAGGAILTWYDNRSGTADIYAQRVLASGVVDAAWPMNGLAVCTATGNQTVPASVSDAAGGAIIAWQDARNVAGSDIYAQHVLGSGALDPSWPANGRVVCAATGNQSAPTLVADGAGGAIIVWQDQRSGSSDDLYAQRILSTGVVDPAWPADGAALCTAAGVQQRARAVPDGAGGAIVTWYDQRGGAGNDDIYAQRVLATGVADPAWPTDGRALCTAPGAQQTPAIAPDAAGGAIVAWYDERGGAANGDIYAHHVGPNGAVDPGWPADGLPVCTATGKQQLPALVVDGLHGAIVGWLDARSGSNDLYAHRLLAAGVVDPAWPVDGAAVCTAANSQSSLVMESDGVGGALLAWVDFRANASVSDLYAQHLEAGGAPDPAWPLNGAQLCTATGVQVSPALIADGSGGAIVGWADQRNGTTNNDIYAQRIQANGQLGGVVVGVPSEPREGAVALFVQPNPCRAGDCAMEFDLNSSPNALLEIFDIGGRRVAVRALDSFGAGRHQFELSALWRPAPGVYLVRVVQGSAARAVLVAVTD